jgi:DNA-binding IclR family transcriptional regulator
LILDVLSHHSRGLSLRDLSQKVNLTKGTTHRLLSSLSYLDFIRQNPSNKHYLLSFKLVELGNRLLNQIDYRAEARPFLVELAERTRETAHMVVLDQFEVLYIDKVEAVGNTTGLRMASMLGSRIPAHCSAVGKALLASLPEEKLDVLASANGLPKRTENTITDLAKLKEHLEMVRRRGYAVDNEENEIGIRCIGAPIHDQRGEVIAAISISVPASRMNSRTMEKMLKDRVVAAARKISAKLGYPGK